MANAKTFKDYCKEAKKRLKSGFWQNCNQEIEKKDISYSAVKDYLNLKVEESVKKEDDEESFYRTVKKLLDTYGETSDALGRLTNHEYYNTLSYEEKQRYNLSLSERYLQAVERYNREKSLKIGEN